MGIGGDDLPPGQWDDELSSWPQDRRKVAARRIAFIAVCAALITLIILTIVFVGNDKKSSARVTTNETSSSTLTTIGFATSLPVAATATSLSGATTTTATTTTVAEATTTTAGATTTTAPTTTTSLPPFRFGQSHGADGTYTPITPNTCNADPPPRQAETFIFSTPQAGTLRIQTANMTANGPIGPGGNFHVTSPNTNETYDGQVPPSTGPGTSANGTYTVVVTGCTNTYSVKWTFSS